jgi:hypothetical protein
MFGIGIRELGRSVLSAGTTHTPPHAAQVQILSWRIPYPSIPHNVTKISWRCHEIDTSFCYGSVIVILCSVTKSQVIYFSTSCSFILQGFLPLVVANCSARPSARQFTLTISPLSSPREIGTGFAPIIGEAIRVQNNHCKPTSAQARNTSSKTTKAVVEKDKPSQ